MSIQLLGVKVLDNPASFTSNFRFQITFDCVAPVKEELEWKLVYVGSADNEDNDQELDQILVGPVRVGKNRFTFEAPPPDPTKIPSTDLLDVTVILLTCSYRDHEFIRIGYYVHNEYEESLNDENIVIVPNQIRRNILADKPRVTRFNIDWDNQQENDCNNNKDQDIKSNENEQEQQIEQDNDNDNEEDDDDDDDDDNDSEDLAETEERDKDINNDNDNDNGGGNNGNGKSNNNNNGNEEDDDDIDMTE